MSICLCSPTNKNCCYCLGTGSLHSDSQWKRRLSDHIKVYDSLRINFDSDRKIFFESKPSNLSKLGIKISYSDYKEDLFDEIKIPDELISKLEDMDTLIGTYFFYLIDQLELLSRFKYNKKRKVELFFNKEPLVIKNSAYSGSIKNTELNEQSHEDLLKYIISVMIYNRKKFEV